MENIENFYPFNCKKICDYNKQKKEQSPCNIFCKKSVKMIDLYGEQMTCIKV